MPGETDKVILQFIKIEMRCLQCDQPQMCDITEIKPNLLTQDDYNKAYKPVFDFYEKRV